MPSAKLVTAAAAGALLFAAHASAAPIRSEAKLASPAAQPVTAAIAGANWRCEADACTGERSQPALDNPMRECRKVAAVLGPLAGFQSQGQAFGAGDLKACNVAAKDASATATGK